MFRQHAWTDILVKQQGQIQYEDTWDRNSGYTTGTETVVRQLRKGQ